MNGVVVAEGERGQLTSAIYVLAATVGLPSAKAPGQKAKLVSER
jgi:hypothetical protein